MQIFLNIHGGCQQGKSLFFKQMTIIATENVMRFLTEEMLFSKILKSNQV